MDQEKEGQPMYPTLARLLATLAVIAGSLMVTSASPTRARMERGPQSAASYINPDTGLATENPDVNPDSSCETPDRQDAQQVSDPGQTNRNVHNDACLFDADYNNFDGWITFESKGAGVISACPDPDDAGPKTALLEDHDGNGLNEHCHQSGFQSKGTDGDGEYHARMNDDTAPGTQRVTFCYDPDQDGCADESVRDGISIYWVNAPTFAYPYLNPDTGTATENPDVDPDSECETPDKKDAQQLSDPGMTNRNVHNDACLFMVRDPNSNFDGAASFDSSGVGYISACPDPDDVGPKIAFTTDTNGDGLADRCTQTGFQSKGTDGDREYHARLNSDSMVGLQDVTFCYDPDQDGCSDESVKDGISIYWVDAPRSARAYINPDTGLPTENPDVDPNSSCETPDQEDDQQLSDAGMSNRNVHNDACLFNVRDFNSLFDGLASFESSGVGYIFACPDPDDAGSKTALLEDHDGDGLNEHCHLSGFQSKGTTGDGEYHSRMNNDTSPGDQWVRFCYDPDQDGCADESVRDVIVIHWSALRD